MPEATKRKYFIPGGGGQRGYIPFATEVAKGVQHRDLKEFRRIARELPSRSNPSSASNIACGLGVSTYPPIP